MRFGVHLPLIDFTRRGFALDELLAVTKAAAAAGYTTLAVNDHFVYSRPWLDGPTAMAAVLPATGSMTLAMTVALPVVRGPVPLAKNLAALDVLSGGRVVAGLGPGSSAADYSAVGLDFGDRWKRFDEAVSTVRALLDPAHPEYHGSYYTTPDVALQPASVHRIPLWLGSWGSDAGLRRVARLADGWLASAYNTTPELFATARRHLDEHLERGGLEPGAFPNALATTLLYLTETDGEAEQLLTDVVGPAMNRTPEQLRERILVCTVRRAVERIGRYRDAGLQELIVWPIADEVDQVNAFAREVVPLAV